MRCNHYIFYPEQVGWQTKFTLKITESGLVTSLHKYEQRFCLGDTVHKALITTSMPVSPIAKGFE